MRGHFWWDIPYSDVMDWFLLYLLLTFHLNRHRPILPRHFDAFLSSVILIHISIIPLFSQIGTFGLLLCWCHIGTLQQPRGSCNEGTNVSANGWFKISFLAIIVWVIKTITLKDLGEPEEVCWAYSSPNLIHNMILLQERRQIIK